MRDGLFTVLGVAILIGFLIWIIPLGLIWSLNTLFGLGIEVTFWTWAAALFLSLAVSGSASRK